MDKQIQEIQNRCEFYSENYRTLVTGQALLQSIADIRYLLKIIEAVQVNERRLVQNLEREKQLLLDRLNECDRNIEVFGKPKIRTTNNLPE